MSADFRPRPPASRSRRRAPHRVRRAAVALAASLAVLAFGASASLADTGSVYFDSNGNALAGGSFFTNMTGNGNVGLGAQVLPNLQTAANNVAIGDRALFDNQFSNDNIAIGSSALTSTFTQGNQNIGIGSQALTDTTKGDDNVATGFQALGANTTGAENIAAGTNALNDNTTGDQNLAFGRGALTNAVSADENVAAGYHALFANTTGEVNTALGDRALNSNTTGDRNVAVGAGAGVNLTSGSDNVDIANPGQAGEAGTIRIGTRVNQTRAFLQGVSGTAISRPAQPVLINASGQLGTARAATGRGGGGAKVSDSVLSRLQAKVRRLARQNQRQEKELRKLRTGG